MPKMERPLPRVKTDQERIADLERRVDDLETEAWAFREEVGTVLRMKLDELLRILGADQDTIELGMELGNILSIEVPESDGSEGPERKPMNILGSLGLPPLEKSAGRSKRRD